MKRKILFLIFTIFLCMQTVCAQALEIPAGVKNSENNMQLDADAAIVMDAATGEILFSRNIDKQEYPASITKLMTALLVFENCKMDETVTFSHQAVYTVEPGSSCIGMNENETLTVDQCLYAMLLQSANEVSNALAEHVDGSVDAFAKHMTSRAKELGAKNTSFLNANGLHDPNHLTTAYDMALIAKELLKYPHFKEILMTRSYEIPPTNLCNETRYIHGQTQLINPAAIFYYKESEGGKTGFTDQARNTLVSYAKRDNTEIICVVLHSSGYGEYYDTMKLYDYGLDNFKTQQLCKSGDKYKTIQLEAVPVKQKKSLFTFLSKNKNAAAPAPENADLNYKDNVYATLLATDNTNGITVKDTINAGLTSVHKGDVCGKAVFSYEGVEIGSTDLVASSDVGLAPPSTADTSAKPNLSLLKWIIIWAVIGVAIVLAICVLEIRKRKLRAKRRIARRKKYQSYNSRKYK